ncbi:hypothetical protein Tther_02252 [Tepidimonas thermarum]|uniref:Uncharacterized protein n=1 Tax=Tepidimonas thermarum TaxID=335431 RepID=A0A554WX96_9BURK|nr:hypothetical protein Tther_02252 [Tepidimonas thermarum]
MQGQGAFEQVFQLAHIAGERVRLQPLQRRGREGGGLRQAVAPGQLGQDGVGDGGQVLRVVAQRRGVDGDDVEPVVQVVAELPGLHQARQVFVGGADDAHVHRLLGGGADGAHGALLQGAQQFDLHGQRQVGHFVQKQCAASRSLKQSGLVGAGAGKGAAAVAKQFALQQVGRDGTAVDGDEGAAGAVAAGVQGAGDELFAGAGFPGDQHRRHGARHALDGESHRLHGR